MKNIYLFLLLPLFTAGCNLLEGDILPGRPRSVCQRNGADSDSLKVIKSPVLSEPAFPRVTPDTAIFVSAVRCPPGYDWQRDTAYGCPSAEIVLFRNGEEILSITAGDGTCVSTAPDMHHILGGHLYTEYCDYSRTVVSRDGEELYVVTGRELLKGILEDGDDLYTLSSDLTGGRLVLRMNGTAVLSKAGCDAVGNFDDPSYGRTGALYMDEGRVCFAYREKKSGAVTFHMVRDGSEETVPGCGLGTFDLKSVGGKNVSVSFSTLGFRWADARIWRNGTSYYVAGESAGLGEEGMLRAVDSKTRASSSFRVAGGLIYVSDGFVKVLDLEGMRKHFFNFSPRCADMLGKELVMACTPKDGGTPYLDAFGEKTEFDGFEGYLTAVSACVSYPMLTPLPRPQL